MHVFDQITFFPAHVVERCQEFARTDDKKVAANSIMEVTQVSSFNACMMKCQYTAQCVVAVVEKAVVWGQRSGKCILGSEPVTLENDTAFILYTF